MLQEKQSKIRIILIGLCWAVSQFVLAQNDFHQELSVGVNGGVTLSSINFTPTIRQTKLNQRVGGLSVRYISEKNIGLLFELNYSQRGWKEYDPEHEEKHYVRALNYLEFPVFTHIYYDMGKHFRAIFNAGPQVGYFLKEKVLDSNINMEDENTEYYKQKIQRNFDWGLCFGGGIEFRTKIGSFILDGRYYYGLSDVFNNSRSDYFASSSNQIINIKLIYLIHLR